MCLALTACNMLAVPSHVHVTILHIRATLDLILFQTDSRSNRSVPSYFFPSSSSLVVLIKYPQVLHWSLEALSTCPLTKLPIEEVTDGALVEICMLLGVWLCEVDDTPRCMAVWGGWRCVASSMEVSSTKFILLIGLSFNCFVFWCGRGRILLFLTSYVVIKWPYDLSIPSHASSAVWYAVEEKFSEWVSVCSISMLMIVWVCM